MMELRLMSAQPATPFYAWQVEVMLHNFKDLGYNPNRIDVLAAYDKQIPIEWINLQQAFPSVRFFFYRDEMEVRNYAPAIQAHILKKHFTKHLELRDEAIFFHDCDFIFTRYFDFTPYLRDSNWYFSNTDGYLGADYLESKGQKKDGSGEYLLDDMARVVGICACAIRGHRGQSGGAQKLMKNLTPGYWEKVEQDSINLYSWLLENKDQYGDKDVNDIQVWTASMWAELWNAWDRGINVMTIKDFDFAWATCHESKWFEHAFFHNAGVTDSHNKMFFKGAYINKLPYGTDLELDPNRCSKRYYDFVQEVGKKSIFN